jgi:hypothetical protein
MIEDELTADHFRPHLKKSFNVRGGRYSFTLEGIEQRRREDWELELGFREPFNLIFHGLPGDVLPPGLYVLETVDQIAFELYVMPIHTPALDQQHYQASFN